ncbi:MAG TPA: methylenetetrahydrofolate--tRNA-(uracil(54)-C(5))-methyltransferase (FADH(2)-oxidizing) TrmFO [Bdellovibrionota bacterium]|jgi:methylenetetrahydrofolate--tRNA-(uracil-5-)-methyltransferase
MSSPKVVVIGAGLAGCEAAFRLASRGITVDLHEMRPTKLTEAHKTGDLAELVCSNSFKSLNPGTAPGELKRELELLGSLAIKSARKAAVGAGEALAVDRDVFSREMTEAIRSQPLITLKREEVLSLPDDPNQLVILATGPLTSPALSESLRRFTGSEHFYFYDAISPIVDASSLNMDIAFAANRYGKQTRALEESDVATDESADYLNCPMNKEQYEAFIDLLLSSERVEPKSFERVKHFEGCMPIEEMADRGRDTLRHGPMKPVGLTDPRSGRTPWAAVQLRAENISKTAYNLVGFQTKLKYGEQSKVFRTIPGLENAEFLRLGSMHRNTFVDAPRVLNLDLSLKNARNVMLAGQVTGVEGYLESASIGLVAAIFAEARLNQKPLPNPPAASALGSLLGHIRNIQNTDFQPSGINFGLFEETNFPDALEKLKERFPKKAPKEERRKAICEASFRNMEEFAQRVK